MKKNIYIVKKVLIDNGEFEALKIEAFLTEESALNYILNEANRYENNATDCSTRINAVGSKTEALKPI